MTYALDDDVSVAAPSSLTILQLLYLLVKVVNDSLILQQTVVKVTYLLCTYTSKIT